MEETSGGLDEKDYEKDPTLILEHPLYDHTINAIEEYARESQKGMKAKCPMFHGTSECRFLNCPTMSRPDP